MKYADNRERPNFLDLFDVGTKLNENCEWHFDIVLIHHLLQPSADDCQDGFLIHTVVKLICQ